MFWMVHKLREAQVTQSSRVGAPFLPFLTPEDEERSILQSVIISNNINKLLMDKVQHNEISNTTLLPNTFKEQSDNWQYICRTKS